MIDSDVDRFPKEKLIRWKIWHETETQRTIESSAGYGHPKSGLLEISDVQVGHVATGVCRLDFRATNTGHAQVLVNRVALQAVDVVAFSTLGFMNMSQEYDLDISPLKVTGATISVDVAQLIKPGECDRFGVRLTATDLETGWYQGWTLKPSLIYNFGVAEWSCIEIWLPADPKKEDFSSVSSAVEWIIDRHNDSCRRSAEDLLRSEQDWIAMNLFGWYSSQDRGSYGPPEAVAEPAKIKELERQVRAERNTIGKAS